MTRRHSIVFAAIGAMMMALPAAPAQAEKLEFDFRLYPPLKAALDNQHAGTIYYDASKRGQVMDRDQLMNAMKGRDWESYDRAIDGLVSRLRHKLPASNPQAHFIRTVHGVGYSFTG